MPLLDSLKWDVKANSGDLDERIFINMASDQNRRTYLGNMNWNVMSLKIGRLPSVPLDALSFGNYHKAIRESLFFNTASYRGGNQAAGDGLMLTVDGDLRPFIESLTPQDYIDYLFLNVLHRKANADEHTDLYELLVNVRDYTDTQTVQGIDSEVIKSYRYNQFTVAVFDYISRLPELYYFKSVEQ